MQEHLIAKSAGCNNPLVVIIGDDPEIVSIWGLSLQQRDYQVSIASSAEMAKKNLQEQIVDLIILDVTTLKFDGIEAARSIRAYSNVPIVLLLPVNSELHILEAYRAGVEECVVKPISPAMLLAKVAVWLKYSRSFAETTPELLKIGVFCVDPKQQTVTLGLGQPIRLTKLEFRLLHLFIHHPNRILHHNMVIEYVWGYEGEGNISILKNLVYRLRKKIEKDPSKPKYIQTENGLGYCFFPE